MTCFLLVNATGCATVRPAEVGSMLGTLAAAATGYGAAAALAGSLLGSAVGHAIEERIEAEQQAEERVDLNNRLGVPDTTIEVVTSAGMTSNHTPTTTADGTSQSRSVWVEGHYERGQWVDGRYENWVLPADVASSAVHMQDGRP